MAVFSMDNLQTLLATPQFWAIAALIIGLGISLWKWRRSAQNLDRVERDLQKTQIRLAGEEARADEAAGLKDTLEQARDRIAQLEALRAGDMARAEERERALSELKHRFETEFKATTAQMLDGAQDAFLKRTKETFERYRQAADVEGERRARSFNEKIQPVSEILQRYEKSLGELRAEQQKSRGEMAGQINALAQSTLDVRAEAQKLASALRAGPKTRGRWGEEQLRNVVEMAGMSSYVDFDEQQSHSDGDSRKQPDMVVRLPGERVVVIDSKVSLGAFLDATDAQNDEDRAKHLARHADDIWTHVKTLSAKDYAASLRDAMDYVVMFIPGENYFSAALEMRPQLYQEAFDRKILIATPTILIAMLKSAALNWRQERMNEHATEIAGMAKNLYDSLKTMSGNLSTLGKSLNASVNAYNKTVGGYEGRVMSRARKFADYEMPNIDERIDDVALIEGGARELRQSTQEAAQESLALDEDRKRA